MSRSKNGFTLVELIVAIVVIASLVIALFNALNPFNQIKKARDNQRTSDIGQLKVAIDLYYSDHNCYPSEVTIPWGQKWQENNTLYIQNVPTGPSSTNCTSSDCSEYTYTPSNETCPQSYILFAKKELASDSGSCSLGELQGCIPGNYKASNYSCVWGGNINCSTFATINIPNLTPQPTITPSPNITPTPSPLPKFQLVGNPQVVWLGKNNCNSLDIFDGPPRAFRDSSNTVHLISPHYEGYELTGSSLNSVTKNCSQIWSSPEDTSFDDQKYHEWLTAPYTLDGKTIYDVVHSEWYGYLTNPATTPFYRVYNSSTGDHFYTTSTQERDATLNYGYVSEGTCCNLFQTQTQGSIPLYRLLINTSGEHFYTTSDQEKAAVIAAGATYEGTVGYCYPSSQVNTTPLYRFLNNNTGRHFYTINQAEGDGLTSEGVTCYVPTTTNGCLSQNAVYGWVNSLNLAISTDNGKSYSHPANYKIFSNVTKWNNSFGCTLDNPTVYGAFEPSNIIQKNGYYYEFYKSDNLYTPAEGQTKLQWGACLMRTQHLDDANSWQIWTGSWTQSHTAVCSPIQPSTIQALHHSITWDTYLGKYVLIGIAYGDLNSSTPTGVYISFSSDLMNWSPLTVVLPGAENNHAYPVLLDPTDYSRNFENIGQSPYLYYVRMNNDGTRDLMRQQIKFN